MNGGYPLRPVASARTRPVAGIAAQPGGCQRPRPAPRPTAVARLGCDRGSECVRGRFPILEALRDELSPLLLASAVQHLEV